MSQCADAIQTLLERKAENILTRKQLRIVARRLAADISLTQERNRASRESATRRRTRELLELGIDWTRLTSCEHGDVSW